MLGTQQVAHGKPQNDDDDEDDVIPEKVVVTCAHLAGNQNTRPMAMVCPWLKKRMKVDDPLKDHLEREGGDHQVEMFQAQRRQPDNGAENGAHTAGHQNHQRPPVGHQHMVGSQNPGETRQGVGAHTHEGGMADGDQPAKPVSRFRP
jgi:hypothetical protein